MDTVTIQDDYVVALTIGQIKQIRSLLQTLPISYLMTVNAVEEIINQAIQEQWQQDQAE